MKQGEQIDELSRLKRQYDVIVKDIKYLKTFNERCRTPRGIKVIQTEIDPVYLESNDYSTQDILKIVNEIIRVLQDRQRKVEQAIVDKNAEINKKLKND